MIWTRALEQLCVNDATTWYVFSLQSHHCFASEQSRKAYLVLVSRWNQNVFTQPAHFRHSIVAGFMGTLPKSWYNSRNPSLWASHTLWHVQEACIHQYDKGTWQLGSHYLKLFYLLFYFLLVCCCWFFCLVWNSLCRPAGYGLLWLPSAVIKGALPHLPLPHLF